MRDEPFAEFDRVARSQMRPLGAIESGQLREIRIIDAGRPGHFQERLPGLRARSEAVLEFFQSAGMRKTHEDYLAAAGANFLARSGHVGKTLFDSFLHSLKKDISRNVRRRRRRRKKWRPDLLV